jgi:hypothetical protein
LSRASVDAGMAAQQFAGMRAALVQAGLSQAAASAAMRAHGDETNRAANGTNRAAKSTSILGSALKMSAAYLSVDFLRNQASNIMDYADKVGGLSSRLGIGAEAVQSWDHALQLANSSIDAAVPFFERLAKARRDALEGSDEKMASFAKLGVSQDMLQTGRLEDIALQISKAFQGGDPQTLIANLHDVGGRGAGAMVEAFSGGLAEMIERNKTAWSTMSADTVKSLKSAKDEIAAMKQTLQGVGGTLLGIEAEWFNKKVAFYKQLGGAAVGGIKGLFGEEGFVEGIKKGWNKAAESAEVKPDLKKKFEAGIFERDSHKAEQRKKEVKEQAQNELMALDEQMNTLKGAAKGHSVGSLQQMGGFLGNFAAAAAPEVALLNSQLNELSQIRKLLQKQSKTGIEAGDVEY